jgi:ATP-dependent helicase/nuclease subunit B
MTTIVRCSLENHALGSTRWDAVVNAIAGQVADLNVPMRDAVVLLPFAQLLPEARAAFARRGGWMPRVETTRTLAAGLGPAMTVASGLLTFDATQDELTASALLRAQAWGATWARGDPRAFEQAVAEVVATAQAVARAAANVPPARRDHYRAEARELAWPTVGPGAIERSLARVAVEWALLAPTPATDLLFTAVRPSVWVALRVGGVEPLVESLLAVAEMPAIVIDTDPSADHPLIYAGAACRPAVAVCDGFEHEAQCTAAQILLHVDRGQTPVALIAQDRVLVRRVRALLERHGVKLRDETGWKLSTTRAAALVMSLLAAARDDATTDDLFDWLKAGTDDEAGLAALESVCRREQIARVAALAQATLAPPAAPVWIAAEAVIRALGAVRRQSLAAWLLALSHALNASGALRVLQADDAGRQVLEALRLSPQRSPTEAWAISAAHALMDLARFREWADRVLEQASFRPSSGFDAAPEVIVTPLAEAVMRSFGAVVIPGADATHLGAASPPVSLLTDSQAEALGVPTAASRRLAEQLAFAHLLSAPHLTLLRRRVDGGEPLAASPLVERLEIAMAAQGACLAEWHDPRAEATIAATPIAMSAPAAAERLPARLSASACEALRACPYRFFALRMLPLHEADELEREVEKRDYGNWLHKVLDAFHRSRGEPERAGIEVTRLHQIAEAARMAQGLADADFLPFAASFETIAPRYIDWLHARDAEGARWLAGEAQISLAPEAFGGTELHGIVDRIDSVECGSAVELIDYKTGNAAALKEKVKQPLEDTQLAFYAALMSSRSPLPLRAAYLALDGSKGLEEIVHEDVEASAVALVEGLADDLRRLRAGAGMPALGVGATCDHCAARGICRRDHWTEAAS